MGKVVIRQFSTPAIDTLHPASRRGPNLGGIGYRSLLILATLLLAAAIFGGLVIGVAQAQEADGAITGLTLTRTFKLDAPDSTRGNSLDAVLDHPGLSTQTGHKIDNTITP